MSIAALTGRLAALTAQLGAVSSATESVAKTGSVIKENLIDPMVDLQKLLGSFQAPALGFAESFQRIADALKSGTIDVNEARAAFAELLGMLERIAMADTRFGDPGKIQEIMQQLERFLSLMSGMERNPRP